VSGAEVCFLGAAELGRRMARRELSPVEVTEAHLDRIAASGARLNAFLLVTAERALAEARAAERDLAAGRRRGPLHGVPLALKDLFDTAGLATTAGSKVLAGHVPARDAAAYERLREAGLVLVGKTQMHEFAFGTTSDNPHHGPARNPWDLERSPGGSSGGSGAALAAGMCAASLGTDTGGSIRIPAAACGVVGLKPTLGRVSRRGVVPLCWSLDTVGPMARTVEDVALLLDAVAGPDPEDESCSTRPAEAFGRELEAGVRDLALGVPGEWFFDHVEPGIVAAVEAALAALERAGARRVEVATPSMAGAHTAHHAIVAVEAAAFHGRWLRARPLDYGDDVRRGLELGSLVPAVDYVNARRMQTVTRRTFAAALERADVLVTPALPAAPLRVGEPMSREPAVAWNRLLTPVNLAGLPALSVPCGFDGAGLPVGLQVVGRPFAEARVLRVARAVERAVGWGGKRPPV
jgi:aspartyl-tRNA(Asn)/glutamyl-tRNA(Gln) amidotransferase subunit A